jgi:cation diffusion facilitator family transporter
LASSSKKVIIAALVGNTLVATTKFIASAITGSSAMFSEAIHSVVDTGNQVLLLYGLKRAAQPADERFPFGHGKEVYFWSFVVAILIFAVGAGISIYEGIHSLRIPREMSNPLVNYIVLGLAILFEGAAWYFAWKEFAKVRGTRGVLQAVHDGKDPSMFLVLFEDSAAILGLLIALAGIALTQTTGLPVFDSIASLLIGCILAGTAIWLAYETKGLLIGESADPVIVDGITRVLKTHRDIRHVNDVLTMHMGPEYILVNLSVEFDNSSSADDIEDTIEQIDATLKRNYPRIKRVFVEAEARRMQRR